MCVDPTDAPDRVTTIEIEFHDARAIRVKNLTDGHQETEPLALFTYLNKLGRENGIGRIDIVENRFVGIKSRGISATCSHPSMPPSSTTASGSAPKWTS